YPEALGRLILAFSRLPGIGPKTAQRLAFYLTKSKGEELEALLLSLQGIKNIGFCSICGFYSEKDVCAICQDKERDRGMICVVERPQDIIALEKAGFKGVYHVLQGVLSPLAGIGPDDLRIKELLQRVAQGGIREVILAINPSVDGEATALFVAEKLRSFPVKITLIARGLPSGGDLEFADEITLSQALEGRRELRKEVF
ncbi:MAG: recombination mediator RecR, partial [Atribacterota bacterium]|nr:recombination mediator RecR [Atribacterota bacterium]